MAVLTKEGCKNIKENIIGEQSIEVLKNRFTDYYLSIETKKGNEITENVQNSIKEKVDSVFDKIKHIVIPTNVEEFNFNSFISKQSNLTEEQKQAALSSIPNIKKVLNNEMPCKIFSPAIVEAMGFDYNEVYIKGQYIPKPGEKYQEFLDKITSTYYENTDGSNIKGMNAHEQNLKNMAEANEISTFDAQYYYGQLNNSAGFCDQNSFNKIRIVINAGEHNSVSGMIHEHLHAMAYHETEDGFASGFNTSREKSQYGYRKYQLFNEVVNQYLTNKVHKTFSEEDFAKFGIKKSNDNIYNAYIPLMENFLEEYETDLVDNLMSENPMAFQDLIGKDNFETIVDKLNTVQGKMDFRYYDNTTIVDFMQAKLNQKDPNFLNGQTLSLTFIKDNIDYFKTTFGYNQDIMIALNNMSDLENTCNKVTQNHQNQERY